ncbi:MAG: tripartite tricarboxylate transporter family receptor [Hyphomicrobiales bacterium]|nr:tripartite tricarboxylate transporter family receptor [Hyphomicrobiales bacterium]
MPVSRRRTLLFGAGMALALAPSAPVRADDVADFYRGKNLELYIGYSVGGGYDIYARLLARHLGRHMPGNPTVVPRNMEGAGSLRLTNWLYTAAARDGSVIGTISRGVPFDPIMQRPGSQFEATKFSWIGSANDEVSICVTWHTSGVTTMDDLKKKPIAVGAAGAGSDDDQFPRVINAVLGTKMQVISGYPGGNDIILAMERGEVSGRCGWSWSSVKSSHPEWVRDKKINILSQLGLSKHPDLPNVPSIMEFAKTDEDTQILRLIFARQGLGRPFVGPPGIPADRLAALRKAFSETMADPEFLADAEKAKLEINPLNGAQVEALVRQVYAETKPDVAKRAAAMLP